MVPVCEKIWSRYSWERPYLLFCKRGGSIHILGLPRHSLWVRLRILWAGLIVFSNWIISERKRNSVTASTRWRASFSHYIRFWIKWVSAALDTTIMLMWLLWQEQLYLRGLNALVGMWRGCDSNRSRVAVKPKYCCRVEGESLLFRIHWSFSVIIFNETSEETTINFVNRTKKIILRQFYISNGSCLLLGWEDTL